MTRRFATKLLLIVMALASAVSAYGQRRTVNESEIDDLVKAATGARQSSHIASRTRPILHAHRRPKRDERQFPYSNGWLPISGVPRSNTDRRRRAIWSEEKRGESAISSSLCSRREIGPLPLFHLLRAVILVRRSQESHRLLSHSFVSTWALK